MTTSSSHPATATDLAWFIQNASTWSHPTKVDYVRAVRRLPELLQRSRLEDVTIDLGELEARFPLDGFDPSHFASQDAYRAWRRKVMASVKAFSGLSRSPHHDDDWSVLTRSIEMFTREHSDFHAMSVLKLAGLASASRRAGITPRELDDAFLRGIFEDAPSVRFRDLRAGVELLNSVYDKAPSLRTMLPGGLLTVPEAPARRVRNVVPAHLDHELESWIADLCSGDVDEITDETIDGKSKSTIDSYRAAGRKYLSTAARLGLLDNTMDLAATLADDVAKQVLRELLKGKDAKGGIQLRSLRSYLDGLLRLGRAQGHDAPVISRALKRNRELKSGRRDARQMSPKAKRFCAWLLSNRPAEMTYRSFHLKMRKRYDEMVLSHAAGERVPYHKERLYQVATLAAMSAIWTWGAPLRVSNMCNLRLYGNEPQIWLPQGKTKDVRIKLSAEETKNEREIHQRVQPGRHKAIETILWFTEEIRLSVSPGCDPVWMFPSPQKPDQPTSVDSARTWLHRHSVEIGLPMKPHWFRHAAASLYIRSHPGAYDHVAQLLDDTPQVVRRSYAWIDEMAVLDDVQANILQHAGFSDG